MGKIRVLVHTHATVIFDIVGRTVFGCHLLYIIGRTSQYLVRVNPDKVCWPWTVVPIFEKRCIGSHFHQIAITFHSWYECGFRQCGCHVSTADSPVTGIFTYVHSIFATRMLIENSRVLIEKVRSNVPMRVNHIRLGYFTGPIDSMIGNQCQLRIFFFDRLVENVETFVVFISPVLITDFYVL